jgi:hypothetical protein
MVVLPSESGVFVCMQIRIDVDACDHKSVIFLQVSKWGSVALQRRRRISQKPLKSTTISMEVCLLVYQQTFRF